MYVSNTLLLNLEATHLLINIGKIKPLNKIFTNI